MAIANHSNAVSPETPYRLDPRDELRQLLRHIRAVADLACNDQDYESLWPETLDSATNGIRLNADRALELVDELENRSRRGTARQPIQEPENLDAMTGREALPTSTPPALDDASLAAEELVGLADILQGASASDVPPADGTGEAIAGMLFNRANIVRRYIASCRDSGGAA